MSISLTNVEQYLSGQSVLESLSSAAAINPQIDFVANVISWTIQSGTANAGLFFPSFRSAPITVIVNINAGTWVAGSLNGTISPAVQTALRNQLINIRNAMENFSVNNGIVTGVVVPWTSLGV